MIIPLNRAFSGIDRFLLFILMSIYLTNYGDKRPKKTCKPNQIYRFVHLFELCNSYNSKKLTCTIFTNITLL